MVTANTGVTNTGIVQRTSLPGSVTGERTGTGGVNDNTHIDTTSTLFSFSLTPQKTIAATNQSFTLGNNVAVGELVTYDIRIEVPEETAFANVFVVDTL